MIVYFLKLCRHELQAQSYKGLSIANMPGVAGEEHNIIHLQESLELIIRG